MSNTKREPRPGAAWDNSRCDELRALELLVREVKSINSGSHCLERIARCIELATQIDATDYTTGRDGFVRWLHAQAIADRFPPEAP